MAAAADGPLVAVCLRHTAARPGVDALTGAVRPAGHGAGPAPAELAALELGLRFAAEWGGRVLAVTAGPPAADGTLRDALAAGAAAVLRVDWPEPDARDGLDYVASLAADEQPLAAALAGALRPWQPVLVLCGDRSADRGTGALPAFLAHELGATQALGLVSLALPGDEPVPENLGPAVPGPADHGPANPSPVSPGPVSPGPVSPGPVSPGPVDLGPADLGLADPGFAASDPAGPGPGGSDQGGPGPAYPGLAEPGPPDPGLAGPGRDGRWLAGDRRLPGGWRERLRIGLPAVCSVEAAGVSVRRAPLDAVLASRRAVIPVVRPAAAATAAGTRAAVSVGPSRPYRPRTREVPPAPAGSARERLAELSGVLVQRDPPVLLGPAAPEEAAAALLDFLRKTGDTEAP